MIANCMKNALSLDCCEKHLQCFDTSNAKVSHSLKTIEKNSAMCSWIQ